SMQVCVSEALFWYDDWPRLLVFIELWREAHNAHFTLNLKSVSKTVRKLLDFYEEQGVLTTIPWPDLPTFPGVENANKDVFNLEASIVQNDCMLRSDAEVVALLDIDEFIYIRNNQSIIDFMRAKRDEFHDLGALSFSTVGMQMNLLDGSFEAIGRESILKNVMPKKVAFFPNRVKTVSTHFVWELLGEYKQYNVNVNDAVVVHMRQNFVNNDNRKEIKLPYFTDSFRTMLLTRKREVFGDSPPHFSPRRVVKTVVACYQRMGREHPNRHSNIRNIPGECREYVRDLEEWIE
ncbi:hypothetical protein PENTCL1PPCAC_13111, partial [Pristionchus entomophagus]